MKLALTHCCRRLLLLSFFFLSASALFLHGDSRVEIYDLRYHTHPSFTRIVVDIGKLREYSFNELPSPDRIYVDIFQAKLNPILHGKTVTVSTPYLSQIRIAQKTSSTVRIAVDLDLTKVKQYRVYHLFDPFRVVIDIYPDNPASRAAQPTQSGYSMARQLGLGVQRVVIDPGHGGRDPGCIGKKGVQEKNVVLDICLRLKKLLESRKDLEVTLTRETDIFIPLEDRTVIANQKQADLFISIHANANPNGGRSGVETFYLNFSQDPAVNAIAARENATSTKNISEMKDIIEKIVRNSKILESRELAEITQKNLCGNLSKSYTQVKNLGVKGGPFWVLIGGEMPSILVEISHLSNLKEEERLQSSPYRQQIALGIFEGIIEYMASLGKG